MNILGLFLSGASLVVVMVVGYYSVRLGHRAAVAAEESAQASKRAASLAAQDAKYRRAEALLDVVLEIRELLNSQNLAHKDEVPVSQPQEGSGWMLRRVALSIKLEGRLVPFKPEASSWTWVQELPGSGNDWSTVTLEPAILAVKALMGSMIDKQ